LLERWAWPCYYSHSLSTSCPLPCLASLPGLYLPMCLPRCLLCVPYILSLHPWLPAPSVLACALDDSHLIHSPFLRMPVCEREAFCLLSFSLLLSLSSTALPAREVPRRGFSRYLYNSAAGVSERPLEETVCRVEENFGQGLSHFTKPRTLLAMEGGGRACVERTRNGRFALTTLRAY